MRWPETFVSLIKGKKIRYEVENFRDVVKVDGQDLYEFLKDNVDKHEFIKQNLLNATLTFHQRVKMFVKNIIMNPGNPMKTKYYSYKVEFAMRGAAHVHGVLWLDLSKFDMNACSNNDNCTGSDSSGKKKKAFSLQSLFDKIRHEDILDPDEKQCLSNFADQFITCSLKDVRTEDIVRDVQIHNHTKCCRKSGHKCRFFFPKFPSIRTIISVPIHQLNLNEEEKKKTLERSTLTLKKVFNILEDDVTMEELAKIGQEDIIKHKNLQQKILFINNIKAKYGYMWRCNPTHKQHKSNI